MYIYVCIDFLGCVANFGGYTAGCNGREQQAVGPQGATCNGTTARYRHSQPILKIQNILKNALKKLSRFVECPRNQQPSFTLI